MLFGLDHDTCDFEVSLAHSWLFKTNCYFFYLLSSLDLEIHQMDVRLAYLNGKLKEEIFMKQPSGFVDKSQTEC